MKYHGNYKLTFSILLILSCFSLKVNGQVNSFVFRPDFQAFIQQEFDFEHTMLGMQNPKVKILDSVLNNQVDTTAFTNYKPRTIANNLLTIVPEQTNVLIISENHLIPQSRQLLINNLKSLRDAGYSRIYLEALNYDKELLTRGFPNQLSGFLINEPTYAELVRLLIAYGFEIYSYEALEIQKQSSERAVRRHIREEQTQEALKNEHVNAMENLFETKSTISLSIRDYSQYKNIMSRFDPTVKSIVFCGHAHGMKNPYAGWKSLGYWLSRHKDIHIFSVENSEAIGQTDSELNNLTKYFRQDSVYVLQDVETGKYYSERRFEPSINMKIGDLFDVTTFYPINQHQVPLFNRIGIQSCPKTTITLQATDRPMVIARYYNNELVDSNPIPNAIHVIYPNQSLNIEICENETVFSWDGTTKKEIQH